MSQSAHEPSTGRVVCGNAAARYQAHYPKPFKQWVLQRKKRGGFRHLVLVGQPKPVLNLDKLLFKSCNCHPGHTTFHGPLGAAVLVNEKEP